MSVWFAWVRNASVAWAALTLFAGAMTQLLAAIFGYATEFGEPIAFWYGQPLYDPWRFLHWGAALAPARPGIAFLCVLLALICMLAAFAVLALAGLMAPADLPQFKSRRGFCSWDKLSQCGLLAANGLALGAVTRFAGRKPAIFYAPAGYVAFVGAQRFTDASLIAAASAWPGPLVFVDARGVVGGLKRRDAVRFAPGRGDSLCLNPLFAIRAGHHAWADACLLVRTMLGVPDDATAEAFAVVILDQLINTPVHERNLSSLRMRLSQPHRVLTEISAAWPEAFCRAPAPHCEIARAVRAWREYPNGALAHLAKIDNILAFLSDGAYAGVTNTCQLKFADLVAGQGPRTLALEFPRTHANQATPLLAAVLAQIVSACAANADADFIERPKARDPLIVLEADAQKLLVAHRALPILAAQSVGAGCRVLVQAESLKDVPCDARDIIAAIGPQSEPSAEMLSKRGGEISEWRLLQRDEHSIRAWVLPSWAQIERPIVPVDDLVKADATQTMVFADDLPPIPARAICVDGPPATFLNACELMTGRRLRRLRRRRRSPPLARRPRSPHRSAPTSAQPSAAAPRRAQNRKPPHDDQAPAHFAFRCGRRRSTSDRNQEARTQSLPRRQ